MDNVTHVIIVDFIHKQIDNCLSSFLVYDTRAVQHRCNTEVQHKCNTEVKDNKCNIEDQQIVVTLLWIKQSVTRSTVHLAKCTTAVHLANCNTAVHQVKCEKPNITLYT